MFFILFDKFESGTARETSEVPDFFVDLSELMQTSYAEDLYQSEFYQHHLIRL
jgi:hypothetical protein